MKSTTALYRQLLSAYNSRKYVITINMTLADNTSLTLTEADIWQDSFEISTASSGTSSFDIGCAVIGKCKFRLNNFDESFSQYDFFNAAATVWVGLVGDVDENEQQVYYRMGFFTVDEPSFAGSLISLELLDNMWKFDVPLSEVNLSYPITALSAVNAICSYCGVTNGTQNFHGSSFSIAQAPTEDINCREMLQYIAMIGCNFCIVDAQGNLRIRWYDTPSASNTDQFAKNFSTTIGTDEIVITGVKFTLNDTPYLIGQAGYVLELENPLVTTANVNTVLNLIWDVLDGFALRTFNINTISDLAVEVGDYCAITDAKGNVIYSHITNNSFGFTNHQVSLGAVTPNRSLTKRYSKTVQAAVEVARKQAESAISEYDLAVQLMNNLAVNAMGAYQDYQDMPTGGRVYFLSNMPITKNPTTGVCSFESGSTVFKISGDGFFVSTDGGTTWTNGYNPQTGQLIVNVLNAIGLSAEWIKTGELTVGGSGQNNKPVIRVLDSNNDPICYINNQGITMYTGLIQSPDYAEETPVGTYSQTGMMIDVLNSVLKSPYFALNNSGAFLKGAIEATSGHIGAATITQRAIYVLGDIDLYTGNTSFKFIPTDYYLAQDFKLLLKTQSGTSSVTVTLHENDTDIPVGTYTADTTGVESATLDHTVGVTEGDYYLITISGSSTNISVKDGILAYVGQEGFMGTLRGIFKGHIDGNGSLRGKFSGDATGTFNGTATIPNGTLGGMPFSGKNFTVGNDAVTFYLDEHNWIRIDVRNTAKPKVTRGYRLNNVDYEEDVAWGDFQSEISTSATVPIGTANDGDMTIVQSSLATPYDELWRYDNGWYKVKLGTVLDGTLLTRIESGTTDIGEGVAMTAGTMYLVYE